ncbi:putative quinol monooxygenase [Dellaglioa sp. BT-FLS60]
MVTLKKAPLLRLFKLTIDAANSTQYKAVGLHNLTTSIQQEKGTLAMYSAHLDSAGTDNIVIEAYQDEASYEKHAKSSQFGDFKTVAGQIVIDKKMINLKPELLLSQPMPLYEVTQLRNQCRLTQLEIRPDAQADFKVALVAMMTQSLENESGMQVMYAATDEKTPNQWVLIEIYQDVVADEKHQQTGYFKHYLKITQGMISSQIIQNLQPDVLVNQGGIRFESLN